MNIIIVGAGSVGFTAAEVLSPMHDVLVIENDHGRAEAVKSLVNASFYNDDGANPEILKDAIKRHRADTIIATTSRDDVNLFICMMAKQIDGSIKTVARIRHPDYIIPIDKDNPTGPAPNIIISPELTTAEKISNLALLENSVDFESLTNLNLVMAQFLVKKEHTDVVGKTVINLKKPDDCSIVAIYRDDDVILNNEITELHVGDRICLLGSMEAITAFNKSMGVTREANEFVILGGGIVGEHIARMLENKKRYVKLLEPDPIRCRKLAKILNNTIVVNGNISDPHLLRAENIGRADFIACVTKEDEMNLLASLMSMKMGADRVVSRYSMLEYEDIFDFTGIQSAVGNHLVVANEITKTLISDEEAIMRMKHEDELFFSVTVDESSNVCGQCMGDIKFPDGARIACVIKPETKNVVFPRMDTVLENGDRLLLFTYNVKISKLQRLLGIPMMQEL